MSLHAHAPSHEPAPVPEPPRASPGIARDQPRPVAPVVEEPELEAEAEPFDPDTLPRWLDPTHALVLAVGAVTWQFVSYYARMQLPRVEASGTPLTNFDLFVRSLPLAGGNLGATPGVLLAVVAIGIVGAGFRLGLRDRRIQAIVLGVAAASLLIGVSLPSIVG